MNDSEASQITISAGHDEPCHMCGESCDGLAGNPGKWPIMLPVEGMPRWHHTGCVAARLKNQADEIERLTKTNETCLTRNRQQAKRIGELCEALAPFASGYNLFYRGEPDDRILSLGHWVDNGEPCAATQSWLPTFYGDVALDVGMVRRAYHLLHPDRQGDRTEADPQQTAVEPNHPLTAPKESP